MQAYVLLFCNISFAKVIKKGDRKRKYHKTFTICYDFIVFGGDGSDSSDSSEKSDNSENSDNSEKSEKSELSEITFTAPPDTPR